MKQEEKLARDVYQALAEKREPPTFVHIAVAEQRHMERRVEALRAGGVGGIGSGGRTVASRRAAQGGDKGDDEGVAPDSAA